MQDKIIIELLHKNRDIYKFSIADDFDRDISEEEFNKIIKNYQGVIKDEATRILIYTTLLHEFDNRKKYTPDELETFFYMIWGGFHRVVELIVFDYYKELYRQAINKKL